MMADSMGYSRTQRPTKNPEATMVSTVATIVMRLAGWKTATSLSQGVIATPIANSSGYVTADAKNLYTTCAPAWSLGDTAWASFAMTASASRSEEHTSELQSRL